jgi:ribosomal protein L32
VKLCTFVSVDRIPCPALATDDSDFCPVHRDKDRFERISRRKTAPVVVCVACGEAIAPGTLSKHTDQGPVHGEFHCIGKQQK